MINNDRIQEIKDRQANITTGKWHVQPGEHYYAVYSSQETTLTVVASRIMPNDVMAIAHAPRDIAYLLSEVERLQTELEQWKQAAETQKNNNLAILKERRDLKAALSNIAESEDEWYVGRIPMREYARTALSHLKG
ncbi:hypothetical protein EHV15_05295 [Paenibacillus oralis]|uniref:Ead/Ea22-like family protein n=1 Tax=Paenibacillus oralis TaxID=2490856 RepID=A0A3P3TX66_9BACL|nr:hypothetical protein [Paenibacillus oralis]RRJ62430.1 hypothetical protein EHV15_05295 [Paenibacillus oralis]